MVSLLLFGAVNAGWGTVQFNVAGGGSGEDSGNLYFASVT